MRKVITITALASIGVLGLAACGDVSADELRDSLIEEGVDEDAAQCVVDYMEENLTEEEFQNAAKADEPDDISEETLGVMLDATLECEAF